MRLLYRLPWWLRLFYKDAVWRKDSSARCVYLTFDDGPVPEVTPQLLDLLDRYHVKATFFWVGENVERNPELAREVVRRGHAVGNHTYNHLRGWRTCLRPYTENILRAERAIKEVIGSNLLPAGEPEETRSGGMPAVTKLFRPPYGRAGETEENTTGGMPAVIKLFRPPYGRAGLLKHGWLRRHGYEVVLWDIITHDYNPSYTPEEIERAVLRYVRNGSVILFHDSLKASRNMLPSLPHVIERLLASGYEFRSLS